MENYLTDGMISDIYGMAKQEMLVCIVSSNPYITRQRLKAMLPIEGHQVEAFDLFIFPEVSTGIVKLAEKSKWLATTQSYKDKIENTHIVYFVYEKVEE